LCVNSLNLECRYFLYKILLMGKIDAILDKVIDCGFSSGALAARAGFSQYTLKLLREGKKPTLPQQLAVHHALDTLVRDLQSIRESASVSPSLGGALETGRVSHSG
jgi:hypothetical protein